MQTIVNNNNNGPVQSNDEKLRNILASFPQGTQISIQNSEALIMLPNSKSTIVVPLPQRHKRADRKVRSHSRRNH